MIRTTTAGLLERGDEITAIGDAIDQAADAGGRLVVIEGPAGIGKSALLAHAREQALSAGMDVMVARGHELEHEFAFGVARQLFEPPLKRMGEAQQDQLLEGAAGLTRSLLSLNRRRQGDRPPRGQGRAAAEAAFAVSHGFYWLAANFTEARPLALLIDDAQWADRSSLQFLAYLVARCSELQLLVVVTVRTGESASADPLLVALNTTPGATVLTPRGLSAAAVTQMVRSRFDEADSEFCAACARVSAGSPFLLGELLTQLEADGVVATAANVARVDLVNPRSVSQAVLVRLERLGPDATALARAVAILETASLHEAAELSGIERIRVAAAADHLLAAGILTAEPLAYVHPLLRRAVYEQVSPAQRAAAHRRAASLLSGLGAPPTVVGSHLLRAPAAGDGEVVTQLRAAAGEAAAAGDLDAAITLLHRAVREPPSPEARGTVVAELGRVEALAHRAEAVEHLGAALRLLDDPAQRVEVACTLGEVLVWGAGQSVAAYEMLSGVLSELGDDVAPQLRAPLETIRTATASIDRRLVDKIEPRLGELRELARAAGEAGRALTVFDACWQAQTGAEGGWRERLDQSLGDGSLVAAETGGAPIVVYATIVLVLSDEVDRARALLSAIRADARTRSSIISHAVDITWTAFLQMRLGDLRAAASDAQAALTLARRAEARWLELWIIACLTETLRERGETEAASALIESAPLDHLVTTSPGLHALMARARVRLALEDRERGIADLRLIGANTIINNPNFVAWEPLLAAALAPTEPDEAQALAHSSLSRARSLGQPRGLGIALRAAARVTGGEPGIALARESVQVLTRSPARLELAYSLADLGGALRRAGRRAEAREPLREAVSLAQELGAEGLAERAREELIVSGSKPQRTRLWGPEALTPSERRVAELAAGGLANREIAQALFVTTKTVGTHLTHIYQKLDLSGPRAREQLSEFLA